MYEKRALHRLKKQPLNKRQRWTRSNERYARRPEGWQEWLAKLIGKRFRYHAKPLPVRLRPWVHQLSEQHWQEIREFCPRAQYNHLREVWS